MSAGLTEAASHALGRLTSAFVSDIGGREENQDCAATWGDGRFACFVLADGAGGHGGGKVAANVVVSAVLEDFATAPAVSAERLQRGIEGAAQALETRKVEAPDLRSMSTTVAALVLDLHAGHALWAHVGDSRIYLFRRGRIANVTRDHSMVQSFIDAGLYPRERLRDHPKRSVLYAALGSEGELEIAVPEQPMALQEGDVFLICTDGFWEPLSEDDMEAALQQSDTVEGWLATMRAEIHEREQGGGDNSTAYCIWIGEAQQVTVQRISARTAKSAPEREA